MLQRVVAIAIWFFYRFGWRERANRIQRRLAGEHNAPRAELPGFISPEEIEAYARARFDWRKDELKTSGRIGGFMVPLDWISDPEVFQHRLAREAVADGDCDDYHWWFAECLDRLPAEAGVRDVMLVSSSLGWTGGHTSCVYRVEDDGWYHVDYEIRRIPDPFAVPNDVAQRYADTEAEEVVQWWVMETLDNEAYAIGNLPKLLDRPKRLT